MPDRKAAGQTVRALEPRRLSRAAETLAESFRDNPLPALICPDPSARPAVVRAVFRYNVRCALACGGALATSARCEGVALWMRCGAGRRVPPGTEQEFGRIPGDTLRRLDSMGLALDAARMRATGGKDHAYLFALGVLPAFRRRGLAAALLGAVTAAARAEGLPVWLEALTPENRDFYARRGFETVSEHALFDTCYFLMRAYE